MKLFSIVVALDDQNGIGKNNTIPWHLPLEMKRFKELTIGDNKNIVIMGRSTYFSIPSKHRPLKNRLNIVLSKIYNDIDTGNDVLCFNDIDVMLNYISNNFDDSYNVFVIGGAEIYNEFLSRRLCDTIYMTKIKGSFDCDRFFPDIEINGYFKLIDDDDKFNQINNENGIEYQYLLYKINKK
jgi:dihydrofolate reductase